MTTTTDAMAMAREARRLTRRIAKLGEQRSKLRAQRPRLLLDANRAGLSYTTLAEICEIDPSLVDREIREAKRGEGSD